MIHLTWTHLLNDVNDYVCWVGEYFCHVWLLNNEWAWTVMNFNGKLENGYASSFELAEVRVTEILDELAA